MTPTEAANLLDAADECRRAQRAYFHGRSPWALQRAKETERKLDEIIKTLQSPVKQQELFDNAQPSKGHAE